MLFRIGTEAGFFYVEAKTYGEAVSVFKKATNAKSEPLEVNLLHRGPVLRQEEV